MDNHHSIFVLYDGIENSVFQSQVLQPLCKRVQNQNKCYVTIISFERNVKRALALVKQFVKHQQISIIVMKKYGIFVPGRLWLATFQLVRFLRTHRKSDIIVRGPFAGLVVQRAVFLLQSNNNILIQARGLCAEEYRYTHEADRGVKLLCHWVRYQLLKRLEASVYRNAFAIEAVSSALKEYLIKTFGACAGIITIAEHDRIDTIRQEKIAEWKMQARQELCIPLDAVVYCYSGSYKPWQHVAESVAYVAQNYKKDKKSFLLVLSHDKDAFSKVLAVSGLPAEQYRMLSVAPQRLTFYLAAADFGLLFRRQDVINWVSRPTKMLEYQALGLTIIHNNTIQALLD